MTGGTGMLRSGGGAPHYNQTGTLASRPAAPNPGVQRLGEEMGDETTERGGNQDGCQEEWEDQRHLPACAKKEIKESKDYKHVGEIDLVAVLAESQKRS